MKQKAFTLAEVMIVLTLIGIISAIILPVGMKSTPNEKIMKFKKANSTLFKAVQELAGSGKYYKDGNLSLKPNGDDVVEANYLCTTLADLMSIKDNAPCPSTNTGESYITEGDSKGTLDTKCASAQTKTTAGFTTTDGVIWFDADPSYHMGTISSETKFFEHKSDNFYDYYKVFCIDIDGLNTGIAPFGYGIRIDGKIITGAQADLWMDKDIKEKL